MPWPQLLLTSLHSCYCPATNNMVGSTHFCNWRSPQHKQMMWPHVSVATRCQGMLQLHPLENTQPNILLEQKDMQQPIQILPLNKGTRYLGLYVTTDHNMHPMEEHLWQIATFIQWHFKEPPCHVAKLVSFTDHVLSWPLHTLFLPYGSQINFWKNPPLVHYHNPEQNGIPPKASEKSGVCTLGYGRSHPMQSATWDGNTSDFILNLPHANQNSPWPCNGNSDQNLSSVGRQPNPYLSWHLPMPMGPQPMEIADSEDPTGIQPLHPIWCMGVLPPICQHNSYIMETFADAGLTNPQLEQLMPVECFCKLQLLRNAPTTPSSTYYLKSFANCIMTPLKDWKASVNCYFSGWLLTNCPQNAGNSGQKHMQYLHRLCQRKTSPQSSQPMDTALQNVLVLEMATVP